jgi:hypothetical protein
MTRRLIVNIFKIVFIASLLSVLLFANTARGTSLNFTAYFFNEIAGIFQNPKTQWMIFLCFGIYLIIFFSLRNRCASIFWQPSTPHFWLAWGLFISSISYFLQHSLSSDALIFLGMPMAAQGIAVWSRFEKEIDCVSLFIMLLLILFTLASISHLNLYHYEYRGSVRWSGLWDSPNIAGLLMGSGLTFCIGLGIKTWQAEQRYYGLGLNKNYIRVLCFIAGLLLAHVLLCSYCRGAWLGAICGAAYLIMKSERNAEVSRISWFNRSGLSVWSICIFIAVLCFWHSDWTGSRFVQRAFSVANQNDFSWRNRIAAWDGALQIIAEHPWCGAGWNQPETLYKQYYLLPKLNQETAIEMNDYLMLGATLGIPALLCFGIYIWLSLKSEVGREKLEVGEQAVDANLPISHFVFHTSDFLSIVCRAGAIVLLVGFWFDGGLFKLATASTFWMLLELGAVKSPQKGTSGAKSEPAPVM